MTLVRIKPIKKSMVEELAGSLSHLIPEAKKGKSFAYIRRKTQQEAARILAAK